MIERQDALKSSVWSRFVQEGVLDENRISKRISESWYICRQDGVDPYSGKGEKVLPQNQFLQRKNANGQLLYAALPFIRNLQKFFSHTKSLFLLVDSDGYVLYMDGDSIALEKAGAINFIEGVKWTEKEVGTNAVGTALRTKEPITVIGTEHYAVASHSWGCSSSPIMNEDGQLAGALNISYPLEYGIHEHMLPAVVSAAYAIEQKLLALEKDKELELMRYASPFHFQAPLSLICNENNKVIWLSTPLQKEFSDWHGMTFSEIVKAGYAVIEKHPLYSPTQRNLIGYRICLKKEEPSVKKCAFHSAFRFDGVSGASESFRTAMLQAEKAAGTNITVHLCGETGTGKEIMARSIHLNSSRKDGPFITVNCGIIPKELIASELFGYAGGAFTGAKRQGHKGKFQQAHGGTLFLDEIAEIPQEMQVALLRVLEEKKVVPVGGSKSLPVDVRVITATHRDLRELVRKGVLREDLFYRIFIYAIQLPPLRERIEDLPFFIYHYCRKNNRPVTFSQEVMECLQTYRWPGNIRELQNFLDRLWIEYKNRPPTLEEIQSLLYSIDTPAHQPGSLQLNTLTYREQIEKTKMRNALLAVEGNVTKAAEKLNISRSTFYRKIKKYNL